MAIAFNEGPNAAVYSRRILDVAFLKKFTALNMLQKFVVGLRLLKGT
jgi:hypothetical protein